MSVTLHTDGSWSLVGWRIEGEWYWLKHYCPGSGWRGNGCVLRTHTDINDPCHVCGSVCPPGLMGMYNMMVYL